jgi:competence protein ComEA
VKSLIVVSCAGLALLMGGGAMASHPPKKVAQLQKVGRVSVNQADAKVLKKLPGIGAVTAKRIVAYREKHGPFKALKDLVAVRGVSAHKLKQLDKRIGL